MQRSFCLKDIGSDELYTIENPSMLIGRSPQCDIHIDSTLLSRHHASILIMEDGSVLIKDLDSTNGTFVNSMRVTRPVRLEHGDVVTIGDAKFIFIDPDKEQNEAAFNNLYDNAHEFEFEEDATSNRTMVQSSVFKSLGLDPSQFNLNGGLSDEDSLLGYVPNERGKQLDPQNIPAVFIIKSGRKRGTIVKLSLPAFSEKSWSVGRGQLCDVVLDDPTVSSSHATIRWQDQKWFIEDCQSTNGIKLNGQTVKSAYFENDDVVSIGSIKLLFKEVLPKS